MAGRGPQSFKKRQKEQERKDHQQAKLEKKLQRRRESRENPADSSVQPPGDLGVIERVETGN